MLCLKLLNISELPRCKLPQYDVALPASLFTRSLPFFPVRPRQYISRTFRKADAEHWHMPARASRSTFTFCSKHIDLWERWHVWSDCYFWRQSAEWKQSVIKSVDHTCIKPCLPDNVCDSLPFHKATRMCESWGLIMNGFVFIYTSNADFR